MAKKKEKKDLVEHSERKHALLAASHAERWIACPPSARLEEKFRESCGEETSVYAEEGTLAHEFAELRMRKIDGSITPAEFNIRLEKLRSHELYSEEIEENVDKYTSYILEAYASAKTKTTDPVLFIEERLDFSSIVPDGFGTGDAGIIADGVMEIIDLKYGKGIRVDAKENPQLMLYALGALYAYEMMYDIHQVKMTIVQPRMDSISSWTADVKALYKWAEEVAKPAAKKAYEGKGLQKAGDHCKFCLVKPMCATLASRNIALAKHEFKDPHLLTEKQVLDVYKQIPMLVDWAESVSNFLLKQAMAGRKIEGYKLVEGRSLRKWADEEAVKKILAENGFAREDFTKTELRGISDIEKLTGKKLFSDLFSKLIVKPQGKPTLAPESDKRPATDPTQQAKEDFNEQ